MASALRKMLFLMIILSFYEASALLEQGIFNLQFSEESNVAAITKSMYNNTEISVHIDCSSEPVVVLTFEWYLWWSPCANHFQNLGIDQNSPLLTQNFARNPTDNSTIREEMYFQKSATILRKECSGVIHFPDPKQEMVNILEIGIDRVQRMVIFDPQGVVDKVEAFFWQYLRHITTPPKIKKWSISQKCKVFLPRSHNLNTEKLEQQPNGWKVGTNRILSDYKLRTYKDERKLGPTLQGTAKPGSTTTTKATTTPKLQARKKRGATEPKPILTSTTTAKTFQDNIDYQVVTTTKNDGTHMFVLVISPEKDTNEKFKANVTIYMKGPHGYLSAIEWPLLPFYGTMCLVYLIYGILWLIIMGCNWRDLLRVQFWIGGVILIGMLEKAVFFAEFESVNTTGKSVKGALIFAEIVSSLKRATARVLVIIVSLGFGIVKPRLGAMLHKVVGVGTLYFILAAIESCVRVTSDNKQNNNKASLISSIPLAVLDAALCWWVFTSLVQTTRTLRLRRNVVKLSLYRHFTNTLIFAVLASIAYMIWSIKQHKFAVCLKDWREMWVDDAFWHILFCIILMVIMVLWRPTINNQRYAFSPLLDAAEEDDSDDEKPMNEALDAQKRQSKTRQVTPRDKSKSTDEDLKWIEDNIPASVADTALPSLLDSDEEIMTTKYEMSKME